MEIAGPASDSHLVGPNLRPKTHKLISGQLEYSRALMTLRQTVCNSTVARWEFNMFRSAPVLIGKVDFTVSQRHHKSLSAHHWQALGRSIVHPENGIVQATKNKDPTTEYGFPTPMSRIVPV